MLREAAEKRLGEAIGDKMPVGFRDVSRPWREQRSARGAILPRRPATDAVPILAAPQDRVLEFVAVFNSTCFDFLVRGHMPGPHVKTAWMLSQIAAPLPGLDPAIASNAERLSLTSQSVADAFDRKPYCWDEDERYALDIETDVLVARAYGLSCTEYEIVLDSFEVMAREEERKHGHYKFRDDCLSLFEQRSD